MANKSNDSATHIDLDRDEWVSFGEYNKEKAEKYVLDRARESFPSNTEISPDLHTRPGLTDAQVRFILGRK
ncbi:MAG: hypothetical protein QM537_05310 [Candidatus Symbiobacter sp.]|nr:hypothetical protein [Candidatus Symbiobacter sp.]